MNANREHERKHETRTLMQMQLLQDIREPMKHHDMSQACHMRHIIMPDDQTIKK